MLNRVRRLRGQVESIEHAIEREADCSEILQRFPPAAALSTP